MNIRTLIVTSLIILLSPLAQAGVYKWVDEKGNVHYTQSPPPQGDYKSMKAPPPPASGPAPYSSTQLDTDSKQAGDEANSESKDTAVDETEKNAELRARSCETAKKNLQIYQVYRRIKGEDGEVKPLDDKVRQQKIEESKQAIQDFCN